MTKLPRRELLQLAHTFKADRHDPEGMLLSEKLDGFRAWWDGGASRGVPTVDVPWSSIYENDGKTLKNKIKTTASGLWSRYGNPIQAPEWFLDALPKDVSFDGELYAGHGNFQKVMKAARKDVPIDSEWEGLSYHVFGAPTFAQVLQRGLIKMSGSVVYHREIDQQACLEFVAKRLISVDPAYLPALVFGLAQQPSVTFSEECDKIDEICFNNGSDLCVSVRQEVCYSLAQALDRAQEVSDAGGEGVMLKCPGSVWGPKRSHHILKVKPREDSEATVIGFVAGKKGKLLGKLGCLIVRWHGDPTATCGLLKKGIDFEIGTGLTFADREIDPVENFELAFNNPGKPIKIDSTGQFALGDRITFSYRELSDGGVPKEASYSRKALAQ